MTPMPMDGSCRIRRSIMPTCVASWNFSTASHWSLTVAAGLLPSLGRSFLIFCPMIFNVSWVLFPLAIRTTASILQPTIVPFNAGLLRWKLPSGPYPTVRPTVQHHGTTTKGTPLGLHLSMTSSLKEVKKFEVWGGRPTIQSQTRCQAQRILSCYSDSTITTIF